MSCDLETMNPLETYFGPEPLPGNANSEHPFPPLQLLQPDASAILGNTSNGAETSSGPLAPPPGSLVSDKGEVYTPPPRPPIVEREKLKRVRRKSDEPAAKPGRASWIWGTKLAFFLNRKEAWVTASESKTTGAFYMKMAKLYAAKYGFDLKDHEDFEFDVVDPPDWVADIVVNVRLSPDEMKRRQEFYSKLKEVRVIFSGWRAESRREELIAITAPGGVVPDTVQ